MMKVTYREEIRVEVIVDTWTYFRPENHIVGEDTEIKECKNVVEQIERHVDGVKNCYVLWDTEERCSFCGYEWEVDEQGCPLCCDKAIKEWEEQKHET